MSELPMQKMERAYATSTELTELLGKDKGFGHPIPLPVRYAVRAESAQPEIKDGVEVRHFRLNPPASRQAEPTDGFSLVRIHLPTNPQDAVEVYGYEEDPPWGNWVLLVKNTLWPQELRTYEDILRTMGYLAIDPSKAVPWYGVTYVRIRPMRPKASKGEMHFTTWLLLSPRGPLEPPPTNHPARVQRNVLHWDPVQCQLTVRNLFGDPERRWFTDPKEALTYARKLVDDSMQIVRDNVTEQTNLYNALTHAHQVISQPIELDPLLEVQVIDLAGPASE